MLRRILDSYRFRIAHRFRQQRVQRFRPLVLQLPWPPIKDVPTAPFTLLMFAGRGQIELVKVSLSSILQTWSVVPPLRLVSDGSMNADELRAQVPAWPVDITAITWTVAADTAPPAVRRLAEVNVLGRKLAAILDSAKRSPTLFVDSDVLWFRGPPPIPSTATACKLSTDVQASFDHDLLRHVGLASLPPMNTGVCFAAGDLYAAAGLEDATHYAAERPTYFSEQTILAVAAQRLGGQHYSSDEVVLRTDDGLIPDGDTRYMQTSYARHYVGDVRHWMWRDALRLLNVKR